MFSRLIAARFPIVVEKGPNGSSVSKGCRSLQLANLKYISRVNLLKVPAQVLNILLKTEFQSGNIRVLSQRRPLNSGHRLLKLKEVITLLKVVTKKQLLLHFL